VDQCGLDLDNETLLTKIDTNGQGYYATSTSTTGSSTAEPQCFCPGPSCKLQFLHFCRPIPTQQFQFCSGTPRRVVCLRLVRAWRRKSWHIVEGLIDSDFVESFSFQGTTRTCMVRVNTVTYPPAKTVEARSDLPIKLNLLRQCHLF
jgi:hypothetical protein